MLKEGQRGPEVLRLQEQLAAAGFSPGDLDGAFGPKTRVAVEEFQLSRGLKVDGIAGAMTAAALEAVLAAGAATPLEPEVDEDEAPGLEEGVDPEGGDAPERATVFPEYFDNWNGELAGRHRKNVFLHEPSGKQLAWTGSPTPIDVARRTHVCLHITACTFGTSASRRKVWADRIGGGEISAETLEQYGYDEANPDRAAARMALHERFWKSAYHWVGLLNGDILFNNSPSRYTYHGNGSNRFAIGVSAEAVLPGRESRRGATDTVVDDHFIETNRQTLRFAIQTSRDLGAPITHATAHRCFSMSRESDPGEAYWKEVAIPVCQELNVAIDYERTDGGRPIPQDWDPSSPFSWEGQRIS